MRTAWGVAWVLLLAGACARPQVLAHSDSPAWAALSLESLSSPGTRQSVAQFSGRVVLLDFWASWCGPCQTSLPYYRHLQEQLGRDQRFTVVSISLDDRASDALQVMRELSLPFPVLWDPSGSVAGPAGVRSMPTAFVLDGRGKVRGREEGFSPGRAESPLRAVIETLMKEPDQPGPPEFVRGP